MFETQKAQFVWHYTKTFPLEHFTLSGQKEIEHLVHVTIQMLIYKPKLWKKNK